MALTLLFGDAAHARFQMCQRSREYFAVARFVRWNYVGDVFCVHEAHGFERVETRAQENRAVP
jgi:hypothetical protein